MNGPRTALGVGSVRLPWNGVQILRTPGGRTRGGLAWRQKASLKWSPDILETYQRREEVR